MRCLSPLIALTLALAVAASAQHVVVDRVHAIGTPVASFGAAVHGGFAYLLGGHQGRAHEHSRDNLNAEFVRWSLETGELERLPGGRAVQGLALLAVEEGLLRVGGMEARNARGEAEDLRSLATVELFDPDRKTWRELPRLPRPRSSHDAAVVGRRVYVCGGWELGSAEPGWSAEALVLDLDRADAGWRAIPQSFRRRALATVVHEGRLYALGGLTEKGRQSNSVDVLDLATEQWSEAPALPGPGFGVAAVATQRGVLASLADGRIFELGGPEQAWLGRGSLMFPRFFHRVLADGERLHVVGGAGPLGHLATVEVAHLASGPEQPYVIPLRLPWPGAAKSRQAVAVQRNVVALFGGNTTRKQHRFGATDFTAEGLGLDLATLAPVDLPDLPQPLQSAEIVSRIGGHLLLGGFSPAPTGAHSRDAVHRWDRAADRWVTESWRLDMPTTQFAAFEDAAGITLLGGLDYDPGRGESAAFAHHDAIRRVAPDGTVTVLGRFPKGRRAFGAAVSDDQIYIAGGMTDGFAPVATFDRFDPRTGTLTELPAPRPRLSPELVAANGRLYLAGGRSPEGPEGRLTANRALEVFDPATNAWTTCLAELPLDVSTFHLVAIDGRLVALSMDNDDGRLDLLLIHPGAATRPVRLHPVR